MPDRRPTTLSTRDFDDDLAAGQPMRPSRGTAIDPPPIEDDDDPRPRRAPARSAPAHREDPVLPSRIDLEWSPQGVKRLSDGDHFDDLAEAWKATIPRPGVALVVGVRGRVGSVNLGGKYADHRGFPADVKFVGLEGEALLGPIWHGSDHPVDRFHMYGLGLKAAPDSFAWRQAAFIGDVVLHDWWIESNKPGVRHTSGLHFSSGFDSMTISKYDPREFVCDEHNPAYIKGGGRLQFLDNRMANFGRSSIQYRPHGEGWEPYHFNGTPLPTGPIIIDGNKCDGGGWELDQIGGGACISVWLTLTNPLVISNNSITKCRTGGIMVGKGARNTNPAVTDDGYSHALAWLERNTVHVNGEHGADPRHAVSLSDIRNVVFAGSNRFKSEHRYDLVIDAGFSHDQGARPCGAVHVLGEAPTVETIATYVPALDTYAQLEDVLRV